MVAIEKIIILLAKNSIVLVMTIKKNKWTQQIREDAMYQCMVPYINGSIIDKSKWPTYAAWCVAVFTRHLKTSIFHLHTVHGRIPAFIRYKGGFPLYRYNRPLPNSYTHRHQGVLHLPSPRWLLYTKTYCGGQYGTIVAVHTAQWNFTVQRKRNPSPHWAMIWGV